VQFGVGEYASVTSVQSLHSSNQVPL